MKLGPIEKDFRKMLEKDKTKLVDRMEIRRSIARLPLIIEMKYNKRPVFSLVALLGNANPGGISLGWKKEATRGANPATNRVGWTVRL